MSILKRSSSSNISFLRVWEAGRTDQNSCGRLEREARHTDLAIRLKLLNSMFGLLPKLDY